MSRKARRGSISGYMHVIVRGIGRQILFEEASDYQHYLTQLEKYCLETDVKVCAYCLMENHVHLLLHGDIDSISLLMRKIGVSYSAFFNKKYERVGHLFQDRFLSEPVETEKYLLTVFRYILMNPQKAGICLANRYRWSSYNLYDKPEKYMDLSAFHLLLGGAVGFQEFINSENDDQCLEYEVPRHNDLWAESIIKKCLNVSSGLVLQKYERNKRNDAIKQLKSCGLSIRQIERLTGIGRNIVQKA